MRLLSKILRFITAWFMTLCIIVVIAAFVPNDILRNDLATCLYVLAVLIIPVVSGVYFFREHPDYETEDLYDNTERTPNTSAPIPPEKPETVKKKAVSVSDQNRAIDLLAEVKIQANAINAATSVSSFAYSFKKLRKGVYELIFLNEIKGLHMHPSPRSELEKIDSNMQATIDDFISRAIGRTLGYDTEWADKAERFLIELKEDKFISEWMTQGNRDRITQIQKQIEAARKPQAQTTITSAVSELDHSLTDTVNDLAAMIDIPQIIHEENEWRRQQMGTTLVETELQKVDKMDGRTFEKWCAKLLDKSGFIDVEVTPASGDQGVDVLATLDGIRYAVQCKCYSSDLGNKPIQEVYAGRAIYNCQVGSVMTNRYFTSGAKELAEATGVFLWDRDWIISLLEELEEGELPL